MKDLIFNILSEVFFQSIHDLILRLLQCNESSYHHHWYHFLLLFLFLSNQKNLCLIRCDSDFILLHLWCNKSRQSKKESLIFADVSNSIWYIYKYANQKVLWSLHLLYQKSWSLFYHFLSTLLALHQDL